MTKQIFTHVKRRPSSLDLTGQTFGRWAVIGFAGQLGHNNWWNCVCSCGSARAVRSSDLTKEKSKSCGCLHSERASARRLKHGMSESPEYGIWMLMRMRCQNPKDKYYHRYGGRGIKVCERWQKFENFIEDMGERPSGSNSIDRMENDGNYEPGNCRWATHVEQARNRSSSLFIEYRGKTQNLMAWSEQTGIHHEALRARIRNGWPIEKLFTPPNPNKQHRRKPSPQ